jgi:hypothetical protein
VGYLNPSIDYRITSYSLNIKHTIGVLDLGASAAPVRYAALFDAEKIRWLAFDAAGHLIGEGGGSACPQFEIQPRLAKATWLAGPDWLD